MARITSSAVIVRGSSTTVTAVGALLGDQKSITGRFCNTLARMGAGIRYASAISLALAVFPS